ncbi:MAG: GNAT family N-acetyltransferase [Candidatus Odinarchaeota archaeon]
MKYREAFISDLSGIVKVQVDTWRTAYRGIIPGDYLQSLSYRDKKENWRQKLENPTHGAKIFVAETDHCEIVGFASATLEKYNPIIIVQRLRNYIGELCAIYVSKEFQRKKIGIELVKLVAKYLLANNVKSMIVWVLKKNPSYRFYEKLGGKYLGEQSIEIGGIKYIEKAYGWENIESILLIS